jgi:hypothetical protein
MNADLMAKAVDKLFKRLAATYGAAWDASLGIAPVAAVKTVWLHELSRFENSLHRIGWALDNLPERCPNAIQFRHLCAGAPDLEVPILPAPTVDPVRVAQALAKISKIVRSRDDPKAWARRLQSRAQAGEKLGFAQRVMYRQALGIS